KQPTRGKDDPGRPERRTTQAAQSEDETGGEPTGRSPRAERAPAQKRRQERRRRLGHDESCVVNEQRIERDEEAGEEASPAEVEPARDEDREISGCDAENEMQHPDGSAELQVVATGGSSDAGQQQRINRRSVGGRAAGYRAGVKPEFPATNEVGSDLAVRVGI